MQTELVNEPYYDDDEAYPVTRITTGAVGAPGRRVFVLQAHIGEDAFSWIIDKEHAVALSRAIPELLEGVAEEFPELHAPLVAAKPDLTLTEPLEPIFRVGSMGVGYDRLHDLVVLTLIDAAVFDGALQEEDDDGSPQQRVYTTRGQALLLGQEAARAVTAGRPLCPGCGDPIDDFGHFCQPADARLRRSAEYLH